MKIGILGLPGSGKSTLWCFLTENLEGPDLALVGKLQLKRVPVHDPRLERLRDDYQPKKYTPAQLEIGDFPAMSRDEGGDRAGIAQLLAPARTMEVLIVILRGFENSLIPPHGGHVDPIRDWNEIRSDLILSDLVIVEKRIEKLRVQVKKPTPTQENDRKELALLEKLYEHLEADKELVHYPFTDMERKQVTGFQFLSAKPKVAILNRGEPPHTEEEMKKLRDAVNPDDGNIPCFDVPVLNELEILQLPPEEQEAFREELGVLPETRQKILSDCYSEANLISFFTAGEKEVRAWTIRKGEMAVEAAEEIHSDIARGFIRAETVSIGDYLQYSSIKKAKEKGHLRLEGKEYVVKDGDIIEYRFSI